MSAGTIELAPFIGPLREAAHDALVAALRALLDAPSASIEPIRHGSPKNDVPTELVVREEGAVLHLLLRTGAGAWQAGPLSLTVRRDAAVDHPIARRWLQTINDRDYRHLEHAHSGPTAFLRPSFRCSQDCHFRWGDRGLVPFAVLPTSDWYRRVAAAGLGDQWASPV